MKKYQLPSYPAVRGRFHDQDSFAAQSHEAVASMLDAAEDQFGVVHAGCGGGYLVNFTEGTYMDHPVSEFVLMFRPERDYDNAAELIEDTWYAPDLAEEQAEWAFVLGRKGARRQRRLCQRASTEGSGENQVNQPTNQPNNA